MLSTALQGAVILPDGPSGDPEPGFTVTVGFDQSRLSKWTWGPEERPFVGEAY